MKSLKIKIMEEEKVMIDTDHVMSLILSNKYRESVSYIAGKFSEAMKLGLTEKGSEEVTNFIFETIKREDPEIEEKEICSNLILLAMQDKEEFFELIKFSLLKIGMKLIEEEEA